MKPGLYEVKNIDNDVALLVALNEKETSYTFPASEFMHDVAQGDVVEVWQEGDSWKTKYREEATRSAKSHTLDFLKRITERE